MTRSGLRVAASTRPAPDRSRPRRCATARVESPLRRKRRICGSSSMTTSVARAGAHGAVPLADSRLRLRLPWPAARRRGSSKRNTAPPPCAVGGADRAAVGGDDRLADRQAQADAALRGLALQAVELVEQLGLLAGRGMPGPRSATSTATRPGSVCALISIGVPARRVLGRVLEQIGEQRSISTGVDVQQRQIAAAGETLTGCAARTARSRASTLPTISSSGVHSPAARWRPTRGAPCRADC